MSKIESIKTYAGQQLDSIFFRPMLTGKSAEELGIKVLYNMPVPTILHFWKRESDILRQYTSSGWSGGMPSEKFQKQIDLHKVKAEMAYSADNYFSTVYELVTGRADVNLDDLSGTELEEAETALFRASIAEGVRATMWYGDCDNSSLNTFDGFVKNIMSDCDDDQIRHFSYLREGENSWAEKLLKKLWDESSEELRALRSEGQLAFFVTSDVYSAYEEELNGVALESAYMAKQNGREGLYYRGIPLVDVQLNGYHTMASQPLSFALLTDRRNLALAVNTNDMPGTEVRMWYNPDLMENRQRAIFMAGCDYLLPELITFAVGIPFESLEVEMTSDKVIVSGIYSMEESWIDQVVISAQDADGVFVVNGEGLSIPIGNFQQSFNAANAENYTVSVVDYYGNNYILE